MISFQGWPRDRGQIKLRRGIWRCVLLNCSLKPPILLSAATRISHLSTLRSQQGARGPFVSASAVFTLVLRAPSYLD